MRCRLHVVAATITTLVLVNDAKATDLYTVNVSVTAPTQSGGTSGFNNISDAISQLQSQNLSSLASTYSDTSAASAVMNLRGVTAVATFPLNSTVLNFTVPGAGININFAGATRNQSENMLKDWLLQNQGGLTTQLLQYMAGHSPVDPVAGNPNSLQNTMARDDFVIGTGIGLTAPGLPSGGLKGQPNLFTLGGEVGYVNSGGYSSEVITLPIRYTIPFSDERYAVTIDMPLTYVNTQGASTGYGSFGTSLRIPVLENWYLTPAVRAGAVASLDVGAAAVEYAGSLASRYDIFFDDLQLTIGNAISLVKVGGVSAAKVTVNYDMFNQLYTNGLQLEGSLPFTLFGSPTSWQAYVADTFVGGNQVYVEHYDEFGFTIGSRQSPNTQVWDSLRLGTGFAVGAHYSSYKLALTYRF